MMPRAVAALLQDDARDVHVARIAAHQAHRAGLPLLLVVALPRHVGRRAKSESAQRACLEAAASAISGRVRPALDHLGVTAVVRVATFRDAVDARARQRRAADAAHRLAAREHARLVTTATIGADPRHPVLTPDGREAFLRHLADLRSRLSVLARDLAGPERDLHILDAYTRTLDEMARTSGLVLSADVNAHDPDPPCVVLGALVRVDTPGGAETVRIVHPAEAHLDAERISAVSPMAQALLGRRPGETVTVAAPSGPYEVRVLALMPAGVGVVPPVDRAPTDLAPIDEVSR